MENVHAIKDDNPIDERIFTVDIPTLQMIITYVSHKNIENDSNEGTTDIINSGEMKCKEEIANKNDDKEKTNDIQKQNKVGIRDLMDRYKNVKNRFSAENLYTDSWNYDLLSS